MLLKQHTCKWNVQGLRQAAWDVGGLQLMGVPGTLSFVISSSIIDLSPAPSNF